MAPSKKSKSQDGNALATPSRRLNWLFHNPVNARCRVKQIELPDHPPNIRITDLDWVTLVDESFGFQADKNGIEFWQPRNPLRLINVNRDWMDQNPAPEDIAEGVQELLSIVGCLGDVWDDQEVQLIVTATEAASDLEEDAEGSDPEMPLQTTERRER